MRANASRCKKTLKAPGRQSATVDTVRADFYSDYVFCPSHAGAPCCCMCSQSCG